MYVGADMVHIHTQIISGTQNSWKLQVLLADITDGETEAQEG